MKILAFSAILGLSLSLAGCITTQDQQIAADDARCLSYGTPKGSPAYIQCRAQLDQNRAVVQASGDFGNTGGMMGAIERATRN